MKQEDLLRRSLLPHQYFAIHDNEQLNNLLLVSQTRKLPLYGFVVSVEA